MNLRKFAIGTIACSALLFASCSKSLSYKEALDFVKTHYTHEGDVTAKSGKTKIDFSKTKGDQARAALILFFQLNEGLVKEYDITGEELIQSYFNEVTFIKAFGTEEEAAKANVKFSLKGEELTFSQAVKGYEGFAGGEITSTATTNKDGAPYKGVIEFKDCTIAGAEGAISGTISMEYTY